MEAKELTAGEEAEAQRIADVVAARMRGEALQIGRLLASKANSELFGQTEFLVRDAVHRIGAAAFEIALEERKKRGTKDRAWCVPPAAATPASKATTPRR
jgi:hypothetical protein